MPCSDSAYCRRPTDELGCIQYVRNGRKVKAMLFSCPCKAGQLQVDETTIQVMAPFKKLVWSVPRGAITGVTQQPGAMMAIDLTIHTTQGMYQAQMVSKPNAAKFLAFFPNLEVQLAGKEWYDDPARLTYVATYTKEKEMQREVEAAAQRGWMPQGTTGTAGHINVGRIATAAVLTGGFSLLLGASRSKDKVTITFVRTPEWLAHYRK